MFLFLGVWRALCSGGGFMGNFPGNVQELNNHQTVYQDKSYKKRSTALYIFYI